MVLIIAHRGASAYYLENTLSAAKKAVECGADYIELDLRLTADNKLVAFHDPSLNRLVASNYLLKKIPGLHEKKLIQDLTYQQLSTVSLKNNERIYLIEEIIKSLPSSAKYDFEVKEPEVVPLLFHMINKYGLKDRCFVTSFNHLSLRLMKLLDRNIKTGLIFRFRKKGLYDAKKIGVDYVIVHNNFLVTGVIRKGLFFKNAGSLGLDVLVYVTNDPKQMGAFIHNGVKGIITDKPDILKRLLKPNK